MKELKSLWNSDVKNRLFAFNRTMKELKCWGLVLPWKFYPAFNRTMKELKCIFWVIEPVGNEPFNRTMKELKFVFYFFF